MGRPMMRLSGRLGDWHSSSKRCGEKEWRPAIQTTVRVRMTQTRSWPGAEEASKGVPWTWLQTVEEALRRGR